MNNKRIYIGVAALMLSVAVANAQEQSYKGEVIITPLELQQRGDSLYVAMDFLMKGVNVSSRRSADFIPVLVSPTQSKSLPKVSVKGRNNYKSYRRSLSLMSDKQMALYEQNAPYSVVKGYKENEEPLRYRYAVPFEGWMKDARLDVQKDACGCGNARTMSVQRLVDNVSLVRKVEPYQVHPSLAYVQPKVEAVKRRVMENESFLDFEVAKTNIRPEFGNNPTELGKIRHMIEDVKEDKDVTIRSISIAGYASPEGSLSLNKRLSEGRAKALQNYLQSRYDITPDLYAVHFGGEDWDGLTRRVQASDMEDKQEILDIIESIGIENGREAKLMALKGGQPYRYMLKEIYPSLRRVICKVDYDVKPFDVSEAKEIIKTRPQNLSLNEMYAVANTYEKGAQAFNDVFETAVRMFPKDETANLNAASAALERKDTASAERYLDRIKSKIRIPEYDNAMGVLALLKGEYDKAEEYLNAAAQTGLPQAKANLEELEKKRANEKELSN